MLPKELLDELRKLLQRIRDIEATILRIKTLVFPTNKGKFAPPKYTTDPASPEEGEMWYNLTTHKFRGRTDSASVDLH